MHNFANFDDIETLTVDVSNEIEKSNLKEFTYTSLSLNNISTSYKKKIFTFYLKSSSQYQIIIYDKGYDFAFYEMFSFYLDKEKYKNSYVLFLNKNFIVVYYNLKFYYYQKFDYKINSDDLVEYFFRKLNIKIDKIYKLDDNSVEKIKNDYLKQPKESIYKNLNERKDYFIFFYLFYLFVLSFFILFYYTDLIDNVNEKKLVYEKNRSENLILQKEKYSYKFFYDELESIISKSKKLSLNIESLDYKKQSITFNISSKSKENLYLFLEHFKNRLLSNRIDYDETLKLYKCIADVSINR